jgi:hypothetical protein
MWLNRSPRKGEKWDEVTSHDNSRLQVVLLVVPGIPVYHVADSAFTPLAVLLDCIKY